MKNKNTVSIRPSGIDFLVSRFSPSKTIWVDEKYYQPISSGIYDDFCLRFSYAINASECFDDFNFDSSNSKIYQAERYGGEGVGDNGGGVRCGNFEGFQIKGIGQNPLAGSQTEKWHSYGGLHAQDAIYELIYSQILDRLLPIGTAKVYGVIFTNRNGAYKTYMDVDGQFTKDWGALLVREICLRPGHFIRSPRYKPNKNSNVKIPSDVIRVKLINRLFCASFNSTNDLIRYLGVFLQNCASQFAFAKVARIMHTGICPSNLCFDGRWIDLTNSSFIGGGENIGGMPPFYDEPFSVIEILREFTHTFSKYNDIDLNVNPLISYYMEQLSSYFSFHLAFLFAIEYSQIEEAVIQNEYKCLVAQAGLIIGSGKIAINQWPEKIKHTDPVIALIKGLFLSLPHGEIIHNHFDLLGHIKNFNSHQSITSFNTVINSAYSNPNNKNISYVSFISAAAIAALKRALLPEYFYKIRLDKKIALTLSENPIDGSRYLIESSIAIAEWVFASAEEELIYLYKSRDRSVYFNREECRFYLLQIDERDAEIFTTVSDLLKKIENIDDRLFSMQDYSFKSHILGILAVIEIIQTNCRKLI